MTDDSSKARELGADPRNIVRLDRVDRSLIGELRANARVPNSLLAERAGVAPSTALARVRALCSAGVITGFHARVDHAMLGLGLRALITVQVQPSARLRMTELVRELAELPAVTDVYLLAGENDLLVHVACASSGELRDFVRDHLSGADIAGTQTNLVFDHVRRP